MPEFLLVAGDLVVGKSFFNNTKKTGFVDRACTPEDFAFDLFAFVFRFSKQQTNIRVSIVIHF